MDNFFKDGPDRPGRGKDVSMVLKKRRKTGNFETSGPVEGKRFVRVYKQGVVEGIEIWVDQVTGVNYLYRQSGYSGGLTVMLDREGRPVISTIHG